MSNSENSSTIETGLYMLEIGSVLKMNMTIYAIVQEYFGASVVRKIFLISLPGLSKKNLPKKKA